jgi:hypothetical protein
MGFFEGGIGPRKERKDTEGRQNTKFGGEKGIVEEVIRRGVQIYADGDTWSTVKSIESDVF